VVYRTKMGVGGAKEKTFGAFALKPPRPVPTLAPAFRGSVMRSRLVPALLALVLLVPSGVAAAGLPVVRKVLTFAGRHTHISVAYPRTGNRVIDRALTAYARENLTGGGEALRTTITYAIARNDDAMFAVTFDTSVDLGGAHPQSALESFNFLRPSGARIVLSDIVDGQRGIDLVSKLAIADLTRRLTAAGEAIDPHRIGEGAGPQAENFAAFYVTSDALHIQFAPDTVAGHSTGALEAVIPLAQLQSVLRPGWRAP
jgi:hypothetical protein